MDINGASAIVTGGASGLGEATVRLLAERGARVVVLDMQDDKGEAVAKETGGVYAHADVTRDRRSDRGRRGGEGDGPAARPRQLRRCRLAAADDRQGRVVRLGPHARPCSPAWSSINLIGTFNCIRLAATAMSQTEPLDDTGERGAIVNTASVAAFDGQIGQAAYSASKGGVVGMTLPVARDLAAVGIRVNTIAPGLIDTPIYGQGEASEAFKAKLQEGVLFPRRLGTSEEFATLAIELVVNSYMNAETIRVDGGIRMPPK